MNNPCYLDPLPGPPGSGCPAKMVAERILIEGKQQVQGSVAGAES
jgi:hypothetical protein